MGKPLSLLMAVDPRAAILIEMEQSGFDFELTGCRFFGMRASCNPKTCDVDVFVQDSDGVRKWLYNNSFTPREKLPHYKDYLLNDLFEHQAGIHVQVVSSFVKKRNVQDILYRTGALTRVHKVYHYVLWNLVFDIAGRHLTEP